MKKIPTISKKLVYKHSRFSIYEILKKFPNGKEALFAIRESPEYSVIIPKNKDNKFIMVKQYRYGVDKESIEFPMGVVEGKIGVETAIQELKEETGYSAKKIIPIGEIYLSPGWSNQKGKIFLATDLTLGEKHPEPYEIIEEIILSEGEIVEKINKKEIFDATTITSFYLYKAQFG